MLLICHVNESVQEMQSSSFRRCVLLQDRSPQTDASVATCPGADCSVSPAVSNDVDGRTCNRGSDSPHKEHVSYLRLRQ